MDASEFLTTIFENCNGAPITASAEEGFQSRRWLPGMPAPAGKVYFCISTVLDIPRQRVLQRRTDDLVATYLVVLDDIGTKIPFEVAAKFPAPSYKIETSPGNWQWGYLFKAGVEPARAAALIEALAAAGFTDKGARRADRIVRLPGSLNDKPEVVAANGGNWAAALVEWHPERRWTFSELALAFGVTPSDTPALPMGAPVGLAEGEVDPVFEWLVKRGLVISGPNPRGWYAVHCPWEAQHSGEIDHGTDYLPGNPGAFVCLHGHCAERKTAALKAWMLEQDPLADVGMINRERVVDLGTRLGAALGLDLSTAPDRSRTRGDRDTAPDVGDQPAAGSDPDKVWALLQAQAASGTMFAPKQVEEGSLSPAQALANALAGVYLDPSLLPAPDTTSGGNVARGQATTDARVHAVMDLIGMKARRNNLTGVVECSFDAAPDFDGKDDVADAAVETLIHACVRCGMKNAEAVRSALVNRATGNQYNPVAEWILSVPWDGVSRLEALYASVRLRNTALDPWKKIAMRRWLLQGVAAIRNGEQGRTAIPVGFVLVLQGAQGVGKSRWVGSLMPPEWVTLGMALKLDHNERDAVRRATMTPITELSEIDGSFRRSDTAALKNFLTAPIDIYRRPWGRREEARARGTSFAATVNPAGFLIDQTGERRFWTLAVASCDWAHGIDLQQLWAEVWTLQAAGEPHWLQPGAEEAMHQEASQGHRAETDVSLMMDDLKVRREAFPDMGTWVHANPKQLARHYEIRLQTAMYVDINSGLEGAGFHRWVRDGRRGWRVPPYEAHMTPAQQAGFKTILGGKKEPEKG